MTQQAVDLAKEEACRLKKKTQQQHQGLSNLCSSGHARGSSTRASTE